MVLQPKEEVALRVVLQPKEDLAPQPELQTKAELAPQPELQTKEVLAHRRVSQLKSGLAHQRVTLSVNPLQGAVEKRGINFKQIKMAGTSGTAHQRYLRKLR